MYFVIYNGDGDTFVTTYDTKERLLKSLRDVEHGFLNHVPKDDTNYWGDNVLIIKGEIVQPREKTRVIELDID